MSRETISNRARAARGLLLCFLLHLVLGCSGAPPEILRVFHQINYIQDRSSGETYQALSLFVIPHDPDGFEDLDVIYLIHDESELFWTMDSGGWQRVPSGGDNWIGRAVIRMPSGGPMPSGRYRVLLKDLSGDRAEQELYISKVDLQPSALSFPVLVRAGGRITVDSPDADPQILVFDAGGILVARHAVPAQGLAVEKLLPETGMEGGRMSIYLYVSRPDTRIGLVSGPYDL